MAASTSTSERIYSERCESCSYYHTLDSFSEPKVTGSQNPVVAPPAHSSTETLKKREGVEYLLRPAMLCFGKVWREYEKKYAAGFYDTRHGVLVKCVRGFKADCSFLPSETASLRTRRQHRDGFSIAKKRLDQRMQPSSCLEIPARSISDLKLVPSSKLLDTNFPIWDSPMDIRFINYINRIVFESAGEPIPFTIAHRSITFWSRTGDLLLECSSR